MDSYKKILILVSSVFILISVKSFIFAENGPNDQIPIAIIDFEPKKGVDPETAEFVTERIRIEIFKTGKYKILERKDMKKILEEKKLQLSGLSGNDYAVKIGEFLSAQKIMLGTVNLLDKKYYINMRMIHVQSGIMEYGDTGEASSLSDLSYTCSLLINNMVHGRAVDQTALENPPAVNNNPASSFSIDSTIHYFLEKIKVFVKNMKESNQLNNMQGSSVSTNKTDDSLSTENITNLNTNTDDQNIPDSDEETLDQTIKRVKQNKTKYMESQSKNKESDSSQSENENKNDSTLHKPPVSERNTIIPLKNLIIGGITGLCLPGSGLAHFIVGDAGGGFTVLGISFFSAAVFLGTQYCAKENIITDPDAYKALTYGSIGLFALGYLFDLIGAPIYYFNYNSKISFIPKIEFSDSLSFNNELKVNFVTISSRF